MIREARDKDGRAIAKLIGELGFTSLSAEVAARPTVLRERGTPALIYGERDPIACVSWNVMPVLHRPTPVGRISMLVVTKERRSEGIGTALVREVERRMRELGCGLAEVTSNVSLADAHAFYERIGYARTSYRFAKSIEARP